VALVSRRLLAIAERMLWWEICVSPALQMVSTLTKLLRAGARARQRSRFSNNSGRRFLSQ
jgi:hypothetical protein